MSKGRPRTRIAIVDPARLRRAINAVIDANYDGRVSKAAASIGIERSLLSRLRAGSAKSLGVRDLFSMRRALPRDAFAEVERALLPGKASELVSAFDEWLRAELTRALHRDRLASTPVGQAMASVPGWQNQRAAEYDYLRQLVAAKFPDVVRRFDDLLGRRRHYQMRGDLAYARILAPLLDSTDSGQIERRWQELSDSELRRFVEAGIERESILLDRPPDLQRAQESASRDPLDFVALYGQEWDPRAFTGRSVNPLIRRWIAKRRENPQGSK